MYYRNANAALVVYELTSTKSFEDMKSWVQGVYYIFPQLRFTEKWFVIYWLFYWFAKSLVSNSWYVVKN